MHKAGREILWTRDLRQACYESTIIMWQSEVSICAARAIVVFSPAAGDSCVQMVLQVLANGRVVLEGE